MAKPAKMLPGYAFHLEPGKSWNKSKDDYWEIAIVEDDVIEKAELVGTRRIDDARCIVFKYGDRYFAQTAAHLGI